MSDRPTVGDLPYPPQQAVSGTTGNTPDRPTDDPSYTVVGCVPPLYRVVRYRVDQVGNDLTATLRWCETHAEPVWVFNDGSHECPQATVIRYDDGTHVIVAPPWENR